MQEEWKDIEGYEGLYKVSSFGRIKSLYGGEERIMKQANHGHGYLMCALTKNGKLKSFTVHRLVAKAFIPNPSNLPQVNHIDENKENNRVDNLEWCDGKYNYFYGNHVAQFCKKIAQYDLDGNFIQSFQSAKEVERTLGFAQQNISSCCRGKLEKAYGYKWKFC